MNTGGTDALCCRSSYGTEAMIPQQARTMLCFYTSYPNLVYIPFRTTRTTIIFEHPRPAGKESASSLLGSALQGHCLESNNPTPRVSKKSPEGAASAAASAVGKVQSLSIGIESSLVGLPGCVKRAITSYLLYPLALRASGILSKRRRAEVP